MAAESEAQVQVPLSARVHLAHAAIQVLAAQVAADVLFVKGPTTQADLRAFTSSGSDVDVLVRPTHSDRLLRALERTGWKLVTDFTSGSAFDHAANYYHPHWGLVDVHRTYPGLDREPGVAFDLLWAARDTTRVAHQPITVPDRTAQALVVILHAARTPSDQPIHPDVTAAWFSQSDEHRGDVRALAEAVGALTPLAVATGRADDVRDAPDAALWLWFAEGGSRLDHWRARWAVARTPRAKVAVTLRSFGVNRYYLAQRLGHEPTSADVRREFVRRLAQAGRELPVLTRRRRSRHGLPHPRGGQ